MISHTITDLQGRQWTVDTDYGGDWVSCGPYCSSIACAVGAGVLAHDRTKLSMATGPDDELTVPPEIWEWLVDIEEANQ
jgi:hypothetical protein